MSNMDNLTWDTVNLTYYERAINGEVDLFDGYPDLLMDVAVAFCVIFIAIGVPGNLITIIALLRHSKAHHATGIFIINLSITDLLFGCFNLPLVTSLFWKRRWVHGETFCTLFPLFRYGLLAVSIFTVLAITLNRYVMIGHPRIYPKLYTRRNLVIMILLTWVGCFSTLIPVLFGQWGKFGLDLTIGSCSILLDSQNRSPKEFLFIVAFVLPCVAIIVCYARIFIIVRKAAAASRGGLPRASLRRIDEMKTQRPAESVSGSDESQRISESTKSSGMSEHEITRPLYRPSILKHRPLNTVLMFKEKQAAIRIEVDKGSEAMAPLEDESCGLGNSYSRINAECLLSPTTNIVRAPSVKRRASDSTTHFEAGILHRELSRRSSSLTSIKPDPCRSKTGSPTPSNCSDRSNLRNMNLFGRMPPRRLSLIRAQNMGRLSSKDKRLLQMILVIFVSFFVCYMPITLVKLSKGGDVIELNIISYLLIYMTTCINPIVYVVMSSEYRQAYKNLLTCDKDVLRRTGTLVGFSKTSNWG